MKTLLTLLVAVTISISVRAAQPSEESVEKLLDVSKAGKLMDSAFAQVDGMMKSAMKEATKGKPLSAKDQAIIDKQQSKMVAIMKDEMGWDKMKSEFVQVYRDTFSQEEVDSLIAFYESPTGQMFIDKQPALIKNTMAMLQQRMGPMMQRIQKMVQETTQELQASHQEN